MGLKQFVCVSSFFTYLMPCFFAKPQSAFSRSLSFSDLSPALYDRSCSDLSSRELMTHRHHDAHLQQCDVAAKRRRFLDVRRRAREFLNLDPTVSCAQESSHC